jgi:hypothetical protein
MRLRLALVVLAGALLFAIVVAKRSAGPPPLSSTPVRGTLGPARTLPPGFLGFNGEAITGPGVWSSPSFARAVAGLRPQAIRVFGGTPADYWDWRAGTYVSSPQVPAPLAALRPRIKLTIAGWASLVHAAGAAPLFDLNLVTSDLGSQLAMLRAASAAGMPVRAVELGNELYMPQYSSLFRDGAAYGRAATRWVAAIKAAFPGVMVAVDAYPGTDGNDATPNSRERRWNGELLATVRGEDALTLHAYFASGLHPGGAPASGDQAEVMLSQPGRRLLAIARLVAGLPTRLPLWVTEWNLYDPRTHAAQTWAQGLAVATFGLDLIATPRVTQADYHALVSSAPFGALRDPAGTPSFPLSAGGLAMQTLLAALGQAQAARPLGFGAEPVGGVELAGGGRAAGAVIVNLTAQPAPIELPAELRGRPYVERHAPPATVVTGSQSVPEDSGVTGATMTLPPFSLLRIAAALQP